MLCSRTHARVHATVLALNAGAVMISLTVPAAKAARVKKFARPTSEARQSARFENGLPVFLTSRAVLVVVMGSQFRRGKQAFDWL